MALQAAFRAITRIEALCLQAGILGIAALTIVNVLLRVATGQSLLYAGELSRFLIVWVTFIGIGYGASTGRHIRMTALSDALGERPRKALMVLMLAVTSALLFAMAWLALGHVLGTVRQLGAVSPVLRLPLYMVELAAPVGLFMGGLQYLLAFGQNLLAPGIYIAVGRPDGYDTAPPEGI